MRNEILLGDEAIGLGAIHAGISGVFGYPGTPSTEIFEYVEHHCNGSGDIHAFWSTNEKVAYEEALGMSWAGKRALVCMKHVGLNVAADAFINSAITGIHGGLVLSVSDDPGMHSSQNEQDSRYYAQQALVPCLEPQDQQECYDMVGEAFDLSEQHGLPVVIRLVTRIAHSRSTVAVREGRQQNKLDAQRNPGKWTLLPSVARVKTKELANKLNDLLELSDTISHNRLTLRGKIGVICCGIATGYLEENLAEEDDFSVLKIGYYPLPVKTMRRLAAHVDRILVLEDGYPMLERTLGGILGLEKPRVEGRLSGELPRTGELNPDSVRRALGKPPLPTFRSEVTDLAARPPSLCRGCPHADTLKALNEALSGYGIGQVHSDIGCYTLSALPPLEAIHSTLAMGASIGMAAGAAYAGYSPAVAVIGDSTFSHGGIPPLLSAVQQHVNITVTILDNGTVAMTGIQRSMSSGETLDRLVLGCGVDPQHLRIIIPMPKYHDENVEVFKEELAYAGPSVIIARRECVEFVKKRQYVRGAS